MGKSKRGLYVKEKKDYEKKKKGIIGKRKRGLQVKENEDYDRKKKLLVDYLRQFRLKLNIKSILTNTFQIRLEQHLPLIKPHKFDILYHYTYSFTTKLQVYF